MTSPLHFRGSRVAASSPPADIGGSPLETAEGAVACGLCGHRFAPTRETMACARCPMARGCAVLCCPRCGYEFVTESRLVNWVRRLFSR